VTLQVLAMRFPHLRFQLWVVMVTVAVSAGVTAEFGQRRKRLARLCIAHHERADACFDRTGRICKFGETPASIEAFYRRQGPTVWSDFQTGLYHLALANEYGEAANRPWLPMLSDLPPLDGLRDIRALAEWGLEAFLEAGPLSGIFVLLVILRAGTPRAVRLSSECHARSIIHASSHTSEGGP
jgi:hypothetical protein